MKRQLLLILTAAICSVFAVATFADPPVNDDCVNATDAGTLTSGVTEQLSGSVVDATPECMTNEVWVKFTIADCMDVTIDFCDSPDNIMMSSNIVYDDCPCLGEHQTIAMDQCNNYNPIYTWYNLAAGTYYYYIDAMGMMGENYIVNITGEDCPPPPFNDDCANAGAIGEISELAFTTRGASFDGESSCISSPNIWYIYTPTFSGRARLSIEAGYQKKFAVYDGYACSPLPTQLCCTSQSQFEFDVIMGQQYLIEVGGQYSSVGDGFLTIGEAPPPAPNDDCANATDAGTLLADSTVLITGSVTSATQDCYNHYDPEVWVKFTIAECMDVTIDFCADPENVNSNVSEFIYGSCPCDNQYYVNQRSDCGNYNPSYTWESLVAGTYYYPVLTNALYSEEYTIRITGQECPPPPANDECVNALAVGEVDELEYTTRGATFDGEGYCMSSPNVWYVYTATFTGNARLSIDAEYRDQMAVYDGASCSPLPAELGCTSDSRIDFSVELGNQYLIEVGGRNGVAGDGLLTIGEAPPPLENDNCEDATDAGTLQSGVSVQLTGNNENATQDCYNHYDPEVWVKFSLNERMDVTIDYCGTTPPAEYYDVNLALYQSCPCDESIDNNSSESCPDDNTKLTWLGLPVGTYYYPIFNNSSLNGDYVLNITGVTCPPPPANDDCENATDAGTLVSENPVTITGNNLGSTNDCSAIGFAESWIKFTTSQTMQVTIDYCDTDPRFNSFAGYLIDSCPCGEDRIFNDTTSLCEDENMLFMWNDLPAGEYWYPIKMAIGAMGDYTIHVTGIATGNPGYEYLPGDANMAAGSWPPNVIGADVTYLVNYFRAIAAPCLVGGFYNSADANGDCSVIGADVTYLVQYFRGANELHFCPDYEPTWQSSGDLPAEAPDGWPNCE